MAAERVPKPLIKVRSQLNIFSSHNFSINDQIFIFSESWGRDLLNCQSFVGAEFVIFRPWTMGYYPWCLPEIGQNK